MGGDMELKHSGNSGLFARQLAELRGAHAQLLESMAALDAITDSPNALDYRQARFKLSSTSLSRRMLWQRIFKNLEPSASAAEATALAELHAADFELLRASSDHIAKWPTERIEERWKEYCEASRAIRVKMKSAILAEGRVLYPILERHVRTSGAQSRAA